MRYLVVVHQDRPTGPCGVSVPDLPGCFSAGDTLADALERSREAIALHVEGLLSDSEPVPAPSNSVEADGAWWPPSRSMTGCCPSGRCK